MSSAKSLPLRNSCIYLLCLAGTNVALIGWFLFQPLALQLAYLLQIIALASLVTLALRYYRFDYLFKPLIVIFAGGLGLLPGCFLNYGRLGLQNLSSLCVATTSSSGLENISWMLSVAPWTHLEIRGQIYL